LQLARKGEMLGSHYKRKAHANPLAFPLIKSQQINKPNQIPMKTELIIHNTFRKWKNSVKRYAKAINLHNGCAFEERERGVIITAGYLNRFSGLYHEVGVWNCNTGQGTVNW